MRRLVLPLLLVTALWTSFPRMIELVRQSVTLLPLAYSARRDRVLGSFYPAIRRIRAEVGEDEGIGLSVRELNRDINAAIFANYYLYPRRTRLYATLDDYRTTIYSDPAQPVRFVRIDTRRTEEPRLMSYLQIRAEEVEDEPLVHDAKAGAARVSDFVVPMVLAVDGQPGNAWVTQAVFFAEVDTGATLTLYPSGETKTIALRAHQPLLLRDVVYGITSRLDSGWLHVKTTAPVRASFWFVNRGRRHAVRMPLLEALASAPQHVAGGEKLFVLNESADAANAMINGERRTISPHGFLALPSARTNVVEADHPFLAFSVSRERQREFFNWPAGVQ